MTAPLRHIDLAVDAPLAEWPMEALEALLDRGTIGDWRAIASRDRVVSVGRGGAHGGHDRWLG